VYHYLQGSYYLTDNATISVGIDNILDESAPYVASWTDANTNTMTYELTGRRATVRLNYRWEW